MRQGGFRTRGTEKIYKNNQPIISIITVVYNGELTLEDTILSVLNQRYQNIEYIIIDGDSTDQTLKIINKYDDMLDYWISEPDEGVYHAMNKGISLASGDYIGLINSGDLYQINTCTIVAKEMMLNKSDVYYGMVRVCQQDDTLLCIKGNTIDNIANEMIGHPTCFISTNVYAKKKYNTKFQSAADYDFVLQLRKEGCSFYFIDQILATFYTGGISSSKVGHLETNRIMYQYGFQRYFTFLLKEIYLRLFR
jgi:glycosyltransferase involved in cell wall biosynthesis